MDVSTATTVGRRSWRTTFVGYGGMALFLWLAYTTTSWVLGTVGSGSGASDGIKYLVAVAICLFCLLCAGLAYLQLSMSSTVYYFTNGFMVGKKGNLVLYKDLQYHFAPGTYAYQFSQIYYKDGDDLKRLNARLYGLNAFHPLQDAVVQVNLPQAMEKIEKGETLVFKAKKPSMVFGSGKALNKKFENGLEVAINKDSITFEDEVYSWSQYKITSGNVGEIIVSKPDTGKRIAHFTVQYMIEQSNVVTALVQILGEQS